jgi:predicted Zn-dependent protease
MRRIFAGAPLALALAACAPTAGTSSPAPSSAAAAAQEWPTHAALDFGIQFRTPAGWTIDTEPDADAPTLTATSPDGNARFVVMSFGPEGDALEDLLTDSFRYVGSQRTGEVREVALEGMRAWMAEARGNIEGVDTGLWVMAARQRDANEHYLVFAATPAGRWAQDTDLLRRMMESLATLPRPNTR